MIGRWFKFEMWGDDMIWELNWGLRPASKLHSPRKCYSLGTKFTEEERVPNYEDDKIRTLFIKNT